MNTATGLRQYTTALYNQVDTSTGSPWSGMLYDRTIDPDGHHTDTYKDAAGRVVFTVFDDGSYTQTLYSIEDQPITAAMLPGGLTPPAGLTIPTGGSETVQIAQRKGSDPYLATFNVYDRTGRLTDVYQPSVTALAGGSILRAR